MKMFAEQLDSRFGMLGCGSVQLVRSTAVAGRSMFV